MCNTNNTIYFSGKEPSYNISSEKQRSINLILESGLKYLHEIGEIDSDEIEYTESNGSLQGDSNITYQNAKGKGLNQIGSLGSGNHYLEIQTVEKIYDQNVADVLGIEESQIIISIHTGSRGLGHAVCDTFLKEINNSSYVN